MPLPNILNIKELLDDFAAKMILTIFGVFL